MNMKKVTRRQLLGSVSLTAGASLLAGCGETLHGSPLQEETTSTEQSKSKPPKPEGNAGDQWQYVRLDPAVVAAEAYRQFPDGGCMYGLFAGIMTVMATEQGESHLSFPIHMMKYGAGGVGPGVRSAERSTAVRPSSGCSSGMKQRRENLIAQLFSWYETTELPTYQPKAVQDSPAVPKTVAGSVLCHVSAGKWCSESGNEVGSPEMKSDAAG